MTDTDKELAKAWAVQVAKDGDAFRTHHTRDNAAARYILATLADDRDARIEALTKEVERLTKERETLVGMALNPVALKPAAEDAELDAAMAAVEDEPHTTEVWCRRVEATLALLAARVKEMRR